MNRTVDQKDRTVLRELAKSYMEIAQDPVMDQRKQLWRDLHDLKPKRPMILFEPFGLEGYLGDYSLRCQDPQLRNVELNMIFSIRQYHHIGDDIVLEPYFRMAWWPLTATGKAYGDIAIQEHGAKAPSMAYLSNFPIQTPDDIKKLKPRTFQLDKGPCLDLKNTLEDIFGDILPVKIINFDNFDPELGHQPFTGNNFIGITWDLFKLIGAQNMMMWAYDHPQALHQLCRFLTDDRKRFYQFLLDEKLLAFNTDNQFAGPSSYGYVSDLPPTDADQEVTLKDLWAWPEAQEAQPFSPQMFDEFFLPYIAEIANMFGLTYYGCCENITDRFPYIQKAIKNLRVVSISGWSDFQKAGQMLQNKYVYSRKPVPAYVSTETPNWDLVEKDARETKKATENGCVEIIFRDIYASHCTPDRAAQWVALWKKIMGI